MDYFHRPATSTTPSINLNHLTGEFELKGRSLPDHAFEFYSEVFSWVDDYCRVPLKSTLLKISLDFVNTSSSKCLVELCRKLGTCVDEHHEVKVEWYYEENDDEMREMGEDLAEILEISLVVKKMIGG